MQTSGSYIPSSNLLFCGYEVMMSNLLGNLLGNVLGNLLGNYEVIRNKSQRLSGGILGHESQQKYRRTYSFTQRIH